VGNAETVQGPPDLDRSLQDSAFVVGRDIFVVAYAYEGDRSDSPIRLSSFDRRTLRWMNAARLDFQNRTFEGTIGSVQVTERFIVVYGGSGHNGSALFLVSRADLSVVGRIGCALTPHVAQNDLIVFVGCAGHGVKQFDPSGLLERTVLEADVAQLTAREDGKRLVFTIGDVVGTCDLNPTGWRCENAPLSGSAEVAVRRALDSAPVRPPVTPSAVIRGRADVSVLRAAVRREGDTIVHELELRNSSAGPIENLTAEVAWLDANGRELTQGRGMIQGLLQPGQQRVLIVHTKFVPNLIQERRTFSHANGTVRVIDAR